MKIKHAPSFLVVDACYRWRRFHQSISDVKTRQAENYKLKSQNFAREYSASYSIMLGSSEQLPMSMIFV